MPAPLVLIDASSYFFRAFHALPPLTNSKGQPTGAIYGVVNMIKKLLKDYQPTHVAVIFDAKGKTFRDDWYPEYKAHRAPTPPELSSQFDPLVQVLKAMGLPLLIVEGVEADDVIGALAHQAGEQGIDVLISTGDKDMAQLVNERVSLINTMTNKSMDIAGVKEKFGVHPEQIIDYLTLMGDSVDNIPGVNKCGPKTAAKWLGEYQTLDNLLANAEKITGKVGEYLRESTTHLPLSKRLVTIKKDIDLPVTLNDLLPQLPNNEQLIELVRDLEFKTWLRDLLSSQELQSPRQAGPATGAMPYELLINESQLDEWINKLQGCEVFAIATETTLLDANRGRIVGISFAIEEDKPVYIPLRHKDSSHQLPLEQV